LSRNKQRVKKLSVNPDKAAKHRANFMLFLDDNLTQFRMALSEVTRIADLSNEANGCIVGHVVFLRYSFLSLSSPGPSTYIFYCCNLHLSVIS